MGWAKPLVVSTDHPKCSQNEIYFLQSRLELHQPQVFFPANITAPNTFQSKWVYSF